VIDAVKYLRDVGLVLQQVLPQEPERFRKGTIHEIRGGRREPWRPEKPEGAREALYDASHAPGPLFRRPVEAGLGLLRITSRGYWMNAPVSRS
jgi:hypothetical protein